VNPATRLCSVGAGELVDEVGLVVEGEGLDRQESKRDNLVCGT
jgi:hypothetical protein